MFVSTRDGYLIDLDKVIGFCVSPMQRNDIESPYEVKAFLPEDWTVTMKDNFSSKEEGMTWLKSYLLERGRYDLMRGVDY